MIKLKLKIKNSDNLETPLVTKIKLIMKRCLNSLTLKYDMIKYSFELRKSLNSNQ